MQKSVDVIMRSVQLTNEWINEMKNEMKWDDDHKAWEAIKSALQTFRDRLTVDEAANLGAQLPMIVRGGYYEGWKPSTAPHKWRTWDEFLNPIKNHFKNDPTADPEKIATTTWEILCNHLTPGEMKSVRNMMPEEIREWLPVPGTA